MASALTAKQKKKALKTVHQKVKLFRAKEPLLSIFMWGINHSVSVYKYGKIVVDPSTSVSNYYCYFQS